MNLRQIFGRKAHSDSSATRGNAEARRWVAEGATLLDVRTEREFASGHIDGAYNVPVADLGRRMAEVPANIPVVVYCQAGGRSARAAGQLSARGFEVLDLGAMASW